MDEVGRGTSTYDGMSLAQSLLEYLVSKKQLAPHCLFATHYHELTSLEATFSNIKNVHMSIVDKNNQLKFLYKLVGGAANKSYGIQVAKKAGLPNSIIKRASEILLHFESNENLNKNSANQTSAPLPLFDFKQEAINEKAMSEKAQLDDSLGELKEEIIKMSLSEVTPLQALNKIAGWQKNLL